MDSILSILKSLVPILEPIGEQGINQLFSDVIGPAIAGMSDSGDLKILAQALAPGIQAFLIAEVKKLKV